MRHAFRLALKNSSLIPTTAVSYRHLLASACRERHIYTRKALTKTTHLVKRIAKSEHKLPPTKSSSLDPLPDPPPRLQGTPFIITTPNIEEYIQPLYSRGWGLTPILPNGNGIAVLRKRFEFSSANALQDFLADLREYEETKQVRSFHVHVLFSDANYLHAALMAYPAPCQDE